MSIDLPKPIFDYFAADKDRNADAIAACFTQAAVVEDEGHAYAGWASIRQWTIESSSQYTYRVEPFSIVSQGDRTVVTSRLVGDFPGSPTDLRYFFVLDGHKIAGLEIAP